MTPLLLALLLGVAVGLVLSAPVGPMGLLALLRLSQRRRKEAYAIGLGASVADGLMATVAAMGVLPVLGMVAEQAKSVLPAPVLSLAALLFTPQVALLLLALVMFILALALWLKKAAEAPAPQSGQAFLLGLASSLLHPGNLAGFAAAFLWLQGQGFMPSGQPELKLLVGVGVFTGTVAMWCAMLALASKMIHRIALENFARHVRQVTAGALALSGVFALARALT